MKNPVLDLKDYIQFLKKNHKETSKELNKLLTSEEIKAKTTEVLHNKTSSGLLTFKEVLDSIKNEAFIKGQLSNLEHLIMVAEQQLKDYEENNA